MAEKFDVTPEMDKAELVYAMSIMLSCQDMPEQINKLDKKCLFRLFDGFQQRGQDFAVIEEKLRDAERRELALMTEVTVLKRKLQKAEVDLSRPTKPRKPRKSGASVVFTGKSVLGASLAAALAKQGK